MAKRSNSRPIIAALIVLCVGYFVFGAVAVWVDWLSPDRYIAVGGVVGGIASVLGLLTLARPSISSSDIEELDVQALEKIAKASDEIKQLELARASTQQQIGQLEDQKQQMEFLVRKASLALFLQEQKRLYESQILEHLQRNRDLSIALTGLASNNEKLRALNEEIKSDPNVYLLQDVIQTATPERRIDFSEFTPMTRLVLITVRDLVRAVNRFIVR